MTKLRIAVFGLALLLLGGRAAPTRVAASPGGEAITLYLPVVSTGLHAPVLKWAYGGCFNWGCQTGWYASPAVADIDNDGSPEVVGGSYDVVALSGATGALEWRVESDGNRVWPDIVIANLNGAGGLEIVAAHSDGYFDVIDGTGHITLTRTPAAGSELRSLAVADLENDGNLEIVVAATRSSNQWYVYEDNGTVRAGHWPQHSPNSDTNGYAAGAYNQNIGIADLDHDGRGEIIGPSDVHYITAYKDDGTQMLASTIYSPQGQPPRVWSRVGVHVDHYVDLIGYADCGVEHRPNFASTAPTLADLDDNGEIEIVVVGNIYNCDVGHPPGLYQGLFIFNRDRTRWAASGYNWTVIPAPDGAAAPLDEDYAVIENAQPNPVTADLDGDGELEILYPSYDGRVHAYWLDGTEHGAWPFEVYQPAEGYYRLPSEPVVADLDNDGQAEVIFSSWSQTGSNAPGRLYVVSATGQQLFVLNLPAALGESWNGALAAPTLANIDADADLEIVLQTANSGLVAYDLPGTSAARVLWGTGRGTYYRNGTPPVGP